MKWPTKSLFVKCPGILVLMLCLAPKIIAQAQSDIQSRIDSLTPGESSLDQVKSLFGEPESQRTIYQWWSGFRDGKFEGMYTPATLQKEKAGLERITRRTLYELRYLKQGLVLSVFDNPWQLYSIEISSPKISVLGIKAGDSLDEIEKSFGEGEWETSDKDEYWWLNYEVKGVRFGFARDPKGPKYPMRLAHTKVVKIESFDKRISFT
jgi:hypothetical protein